MIGGAAGCFPVLVGWAAVTGRVGAALVILFAVIFFWTPPHFWALAMKFREDYAAAGVRMLLVAAPAAVVARKIVFYSYAMVAATLARPPLTGGPVPALTGRVSEGALTTRWIERETSDERSTGEVTGQMAAILAGHWH